MYCRYELSTNLQNFTQKNLTKVKLFQKVLGGYFFETPCGPKTHKTATRKWVMNV